jgi:tripartite-type tricarboxylate transporter receptor subunit TctC
MTKPTSSSTLRACVRTVALPAIFALLAPPAGAQLPSDTGRTLRVVVPFTAGTSVDVVGRLLAGRLAESLGRPVVVDNKPGAAGTLGSREVAKTNAPRDTLLFTVFNTVAINPHIYPSMGYQESDLQPVAMVGAGSYLLVASHASGIKSLADLIAKGKAAPGTLRYGSYGIGSGSHLCMELLAQRTGASLVHVPYKSPPITDLVAGHIDVSVEPAVAALPFVDDGKVVALGFLTTFKPGQPKVAIPSVSESLPGYECGNWIGFFASSTAGQDYANRIHADVQKALESPEVRSRMKDFGLQPLPMTRAEFRTYVDKETAHWGRVVKAAGVKAE